MEKYIICPKCKGAGDVWDHFYCLCTLGLPYLYNDKDLCPKCNGKGYIKIKI